VSSAADRRRGSVPIDPERTLGTAARGAGASEKQSLGYASHTLTPTVKSDRNGCAIPSQEKRPIANVGHHHVMHTVRTYSLLTTQIDTHVGEDRIARVVARI